MLPSISVLLVIALLCVALFADSDILTAGLALGLIYVAFTMWKSGKPDGFRGRKDGFTAAPTIFNVPRPDAVPRPNNCRWPGDYPSPDGFPGDNTQEPGGFLRSDSFPEPDEFSRSGGSGSVDGPRPPGGPAPFRRSGTGRGHAPCDDDTAQFGSYPEHHRHMAPEEGNPAIYSRLTSPPGPAPCHDDDANDSPLDADERIAYQARSRNDPLRPILGATKRTEFLAGFLREELEEAEERPWWGRHEQ